jgi:hypothetical protein
MTRAAPTAPSATAPNTNMNLYNISYGAAGASGVTAAQWAE